MCPLWPLHIVVMYLLMLLPIWMISCQVVKQAAWAVDFHPDPLVELPMYDSVQINFSTQDITAEELQNSRVLLVSKNSEVAEPQTKPVLLQAQGASQWGASFNITANFIGYTEVELMLKDQDHTRVSNPMKVTVVRKQRTIDKVFIVSVIVLVSIIFINFGCALDWSFLRKSLRKPVGPSIGLFTQFLIMPLLSYVIGLTLFKDSVAMRLGFFFTGISPAGGASNIWTVTLGGNLNLSITMTAISTIASFLMIPLWAFTLGHEIFSSGEMAVPYNRIASSAVGMFVPLAIGCAIQRFWPSMSRLLVRILKPFSILLILSIIIFATITNWYLFRLFTWQIVVGGLMLPLLGYVIGAALGWVLRQPPADVLAISVETGIQNTGIAIFMLQFCLGQPEADLTTVVPVAVAVMSPVPLLTLYVAQRLTGCFSPQKEKTLFQFPVDEFSNVSAADNVA